MPSHKRFAVHVEMHPLDYADFEGVVPEGNYGAGAVIVWDRGVWKPLVDPHEGYASGDLKFELVGHKLRGEFVLVRTSGRGGGDGLGRGEQSHWLLIKKTDGFSRAESDDPPADESILSGLTVEQLTSGRERVARIRGVLEERGAKAGRVDPEKVRLALCQVAEKPFTDPRWLFELKYDGYRLIAAKRDGVPYLRYRGGHEVTGSFPDIAAAMRALPAADIVLDGELVCFDETGKSDFTRLQKRAMLTRRPDVERARIELPATLVAFDLLSLEGLDTRPLELEARKQILAELVPTTGVVRYTDHILEVGEAFYEKVGELGLEGMVAKRRDAAYVAGRKPTWLKLRLSRVDDFAVIGYRLSKKNTRSGFGALHLAIWENGDWVYAGRVGSGFDEDELIAVRKLLDELEPRTYHDYHFDEYVAWRDTFVEPKLVANVRYKEWPKTREHIREPSFLSLRHDKTPKQCSRPIIHGEEPSAPVEVEATADDHVAVLTNLTKVFWPEDGYTKADLVEYYRDISPWLLPYLADRPVVLTRFPDGIGGKSFFQKDAPSWAPDWIRTATVWSEHSQREVHYFIVDELEALLFVVNMGTIPLHVWCSRAADLARPDWCIIDLDPKGAPFSDVVKIARAVHELLDEIGLPSYLKTSGSSGLHILIPLGGQCTFDQSRQLAGLIAQIAAREHPDISTVNRSIERRAGRVYIDWLQNRHGQLLVAPFSVRPLPGAPVSMPLEWQELGTRKGNERFTIRSARRRMSQKRSDPMASVLCEKPDLLAALELLGSHLEPGETP